ncbi:uncharacterized protein RAG0_03367 [Rhynchosporium agropyri]|uniref:Uncharacterized protein n=1 Tax=Rhynchosporium agropyri TaxID=914238 RepID=A0A1E1K4D7_9HELO|nr:uncharacterized protein RAG0_03367 [Rhynchosporium agropyri]
MILDVYSDVIQNCDRTGVARLMVMKIAKATLLASYWKNPAGIIAGPPPVKLEGSLTVGESKCPAKASVPRKQVSRESKCPAGKPNILYSY